MHPIFFMWQGTYDDLVATFFHQHGDTRTVPVGTNAFIGCIQARSPRARIALAEIKGMTLLPGPNASLGANHASILGTMLPALNAKQGDACSTVLLHVHSLYGDPEFDPSNY